MKKAVFLESVSGVAGDMFVAAFVDAGIVTVAELAALPALLGLTGVGLDVTRVRRAEVEGTHLKVTWNGSGTPLHHHHHPEGASNPGAEHAHTHAHDHDRGPDHGHAHGHGHGPGHEHHHTGAHGQAQPNPPVRTDRPGEAEADLAAAAAAGGIDTHITFSEAGHAHHADIDRLIDGSGLEQAVRERARAVFRLLAEAEAAVHGLPLDRVAFHEVGAVDSIMDVVMAAYCVHKLGACTVYASPIRPGRGLVRMAHGTHPVPAPASLKLLAGLPVAPTPDAIRRPNVELSTPTGIALLKALAPRFTGEIPAGIVLGHGIGAGSMDLGTYPNIFRLVLLDEADTSSGGPGPADAFERDRVVEIACNIDDDTAEHIAWMAAELLARGALDSWLVPVTAKKGRPGVCLCALATEADAARLCDWILRNGTTFGLRYRSWERLKLLRRFERRPTADGPLTFKIGSTRDGTVLKEKAEFEERRSAWEKPRG